MEQLFDLVARAGYRSWREARGPLGLTQRQSSGKFTRDEAQDLIDQLLEVEHQADLAAVGEESAAQVRAEGDSPVPIQGREVASAVVQRRREQVRTLRSMPADLVAAELQRRGWVVVQP